MEYQKLIWFTDRIGKIVYKNKTTCTCKICKHVYEKGLLINNNMEASYLCDIANDYNLESIPLKYFDTEEERDLFELTLI